jgi:hypothetical protein
MTTKIARRITSIALYFERVRADMRRNDVVQAMADSAELSFLSKRLFDDFEEFAKQSRAENVATGADDRRSSSDGGGGGRNVNAAATA